MAIANEPSVLIADEPTTALDVTIQAQIVEVLKTAQRETHAATILITHDLGLIAELADRVVVMYAGRVVELCGRVHDLQLTLGTLHGRPDEQPGAGRHRQGGSPADPGQPPSMISPPPGCAFHPRCLHSRGRARCRTEIPPLRAFGEGGNHMSACHFAEELAEAECVGSGGGAGRRDGRPAAGTTAAQGRVDGTARAALRSPASSRSSRYGAGLFRRTGRTRCGLEGVELTVHRGETLGVVGESGCGKTTLGRLILRLTEPTAVNFVSRDAPSRTSSRRRCGLRREMQIVFQDPYASLNPRMTVRDIVGEPLRIHGVTGGASGARPRSCSSRRTEPGAREPVPARVLRRPAPAHRHRAGARPQPEDGRARRAGLGPRRLDPGAGREPAPRTSRRSSGSRTSSSPTTSPSCATSPTSSR